MIEELKKAIEFDQRKYAQGSARQSKPQTTPIDLGFEYLILDKSRVDEINALYKSFNGKTEFLYCPSRQEIEENIKSDKVCYLGMQTASGKLVKEGEYNILHVLHNRVRTAGKEPNLILARENQQSAQADMSAQKKDFLAKLPQALLMKRNER